MTTITSVCVCMCVCVCVCVCVCANPNTNVRLWHSFYLQLFNIGQVHLVNKTNWICICILRTSLCTITWNKSKQTCLLLRCQLVLFIKGFVKHHKPFSWLLHHPPPPGPSPPKKIVKVLWSQNFFLNLWGDKPP